MAATPEWRRRRQSPALNGRIAQRQERSQRRWRRQCVIEPASPSLWASRDHHSSSSRPSRPGRNRVAWPRRSGGDSVRRPTRSSSQSSRRPPREPTTAWPDLSRHSDTLQCRCQGETPGNGRKCRSSPPSMPENRREFAPRCGKFRTSIVHRLNLREKRTNADVVSGNAWCRSTCSSPRRISSLR